MAEMKVSIDSTTVDADGAQLSTTGSRSAAATLSAVTGAATGTTVSLGAAHTTATVVAVGTGTLAGTLTIEGSLDGATWVSTGTTVALTAGGTVTASSTGRAFRFYRTSLSSTSGTGTCTAAMMAA
jgi:hypothetical protein